MAWDAFSGGLEHTVPTLEKLGFDIKGSGERNPKWNRDELILALHFYLQHRTAIPGNKSAEVAELSQLLVQMSAHGKTTSTYRNPAGVYMKLMNFRSIDPTFQAQGKQGLSQGSKEDQVAWDLYAGDEQRLAALVTHIKAAINLDPTETGIGDDDEHDIEDCEEGRIFTRMHRFRERNKKLIADFKKRYQQKHGRLECAGCDVDFANKYGSLADRLIDVHHTKPVHTLQPGEKTSPKDLVLLCASCHRAVHAQKLWMTIAALRQQLGKPL
jgi:5-methylcytosine-specific restriction protein A